MNGENRIQTFLRHRQQIIKLVSNELKYQENYEVFFMKNYEGGNFNSGNYLFTTDTK